MLRITFKLLGLIGMSLNSLYETFAGYPLKETIEGCPCCNLEDAEYKLHSKELKNLNWGDLSKFVVKAMTTFGDEEDFKHFLPRIIELYVLSLYDAPIDIDVLFSKLKYANWGIWPETEKKVILNVLSSWLDDLMKQNKKEFHDDLIQAMEIYGIKLVV